MIYDKNELFQKIRNYRFANQNESSDYHENLKSFDIAIDTALKTIIDIILKRQDAIHLSFSGGVDSSLILAKLLKLDIPVVAHTIGSNESHPDIIHARLITSQFSKVYTNLTYLVSTLSASESDLIESNRILGIDSKRPDNYYILMKYFAKHSKSVINGDCIDEIVGGYHPHRIPKLIDMNDRLSVFEFFMSRLIDDHLESLDKFSTHFDIDVYLPYGSQDVFNAASTFKIQDMVDDINRKKPICDIARMYGIPEDIILRRKYGLVSLMEFT